MKILFTGASSFTGLWMLRALRAAGHEVAATFTMPTVQSYEGLRRFRVERVCEQMRCLWGVRTDDGSLAAALEKQGPWDLLCLHGAEVGNYKSADFDWQAALRKNTAGLETLLERFSAAGGKAVLHTGTYFEADEGQGTQPLRSFSPYGLSKTLTWQVLRHVCDKRGLSAGKFVLPNPIGPFEEPKLVAFLVSQWKQGLVPRLSCPEYIRDNAPVQALALAYAAFATHLEAAPRASLLRTSPSGWVETIGDFAQRVAREFAKRSGKALSVEACRQTLWEEPRDRHNTESCLGFMQGAESRFWDDWHAYYFTTETTGNPQGT